MKQSPCNTCKVWKSNKFPECRIECKDVQRYTERFKLMPACSEYSVIPYNIYITEQEEINLFTFSE